MCVIKNYCIYLDRFTSYFFRFRDSVNFIPPRMCNQTFSSMRLQFLNDTRVICILPFRRIDKFNILVRLYYIELLSYAIRILLLYLYFAMCAWSRLMQ